MPLAFVDLFGSPGGLSLGFEMAGFRSIGVVDNDEQGLETYARNFPRSVLVAADIERLPDRTLSKLMDVSPGEVDAVLGGPPCQGFSIVGRVKIASLVRKRVRQGVSDQNLTEDPRNNLYLHFVKAVKYLKPKFFVMENVPGIMSYRHGETAREIIDHFSTIGYNTNVMLLDSVHYGVPQRRRRVFFIGNRLRIPNPTPHQTHSNDGNGATLELDVEKDGYLEPPVTVWEAISDLPQIAAGEGMEEMDYDGPPRTAYQSWSREGFRMRPMKLHNHVARNHTERDLRVFSSLKPGGKWSDLPPRLKALFGYRDDIFKDKMKKLWADRPSWTVQSHLSKDGYLYIHPRIPRTITVREAARLQSFPDDFVFTGSRTSQFHQVGRAVPPLLARAVAQAIADSIGQAS